MKLDGDARVTMKHLAQRGLGRREIARVLGVAESTVRYHLARMAAGAGDGRADQPQRAESVGPAISCYVEQLGSGPVNLADLHQWLVTEHGYGGSLRSVQRYWRRHFPQPAHRARRRVETPPGAQAQADWAEWPGVLIGGRRVYAYQFHLRLSHSRFAACVWSPRKDQLSWHAVHNQALRRLDGVPATIRVDNERTAMGRGAGPWGQLNPSYRRYALAVRFHIDPCLPRHAWHKGKVERGIRTERAWSKAARQHWASWEELQEWTDERLLIEARTRICPATGTTVLEAWNAEKRVLAPVPLLPEPFDAAATRTVADDCTIGFEGRRYSVPFPLIGRRVDVHGCNRVVQVWSQGQVVAEHRRHGRERLMLDPAHYEGPSTPEVTAPTPLGRMGRRLAEIAAMAPETRPLDLYAALAEAAR